MAHGVEQSLHITFCQVLTTSARKAENTSTGTAQK